MTSPNKNTGTMNQSDRPPATENLNELMGRVNLNEDIHPGPPRAEPEPKLKLYRISADNSDNWWSLRRRQYNFEWARIEKKFLPKAHPLANIQVIDYWSEDVQYSEVIDEVKARLPPELFSLDSYILRNVGIQMDRDEAETTIRNTVNQVIRDMLGQ